MSFEADANKYHRPPFAGDDCLEQVKSKFMTYDRFYRCGMSTIAALAVNVLAIPFAVAGDLADFKSPLGNSPMIFELQSGEVETPVVKKFKETGSTAIAVMPTRSPMARNSTHQTASSVTVLMVPARWVPRQGRGL